MTAHTSRLHVWVDDDIKEQATQALTAMYRDVFGMGVIQVAFARHYSQ